MPAYYLIQVGCLGGIITRKVFKVMVDILEVNIFDAGNDLKMIPTYTL